MNNVKIGITSFLIVCVLSFWGCKDITDINKNPNEATSVSPNFLLSYVLTNTGKLVHEFGKEGSRISCSVQYVQQGTSQYAQINNHFAWIPVSWDTFFNILNNNKIIYEKGIATDNIVFQAVSLIMKSYLFGILTDLYGDIPYTEALKANEDIFVIPYDPQIKVYTGILKDLKEADQLLSNMPKQIVLDPQSDVLYKGDLVKWKKFANSLRLRYALRLQHKREEMAAIGVNVEDEFRDASTKAFTSTDDDAIIHYIGTTTDNSVSGGNLNTPSPLFSIKPAQPFVQKLLQLKDPRIERWVMPVKQKWDSSVEKITQKTIQNQFGETYSVTYMPANSMSADTNLYVGLPPNMVITQAMVYNKGTDGATYPNQQNPYISFLHDRYRENADPYVYMKFITFSEVSFILSEAAVIEGYGAGDAEKHYKNGIKASMERAGIFTSSTFDFEAYYSQTSVDLKTATNNQERILEQKWLDGWMDIQSWFDWRRTGYPVLKLGPQTLYGPQIPIRFIYPLSHLETYHEAVSKLEATRYVPAGHSKNHHYSKMWLLQNTNKPW